MPSLAPQPATIGDYIQRAASERQPQLRKLHAILESVAPNAEETIKWGNPFFVEPRFLFAFSAHKSRVSFAPGPKTLQVFGDELSQYTTTKNFLCFAHDEPLPEDLIRKIAKYRFNAVKERVDDGFW